MKKRFSGLLIAILGACLFSSCSLTGGSSSSSSSVESHTSTEDSSSTSSSEASSSQEGSQSSEGSQIDSSSVSSSSSQESGENYSTITVTSASGNSITNTNLTIEGRSATVTSSGYVFANNSTSYRVGSINQEGKIDITYTSPVVADLITFDANSISSGATSSIRVVYNGSNSFDLDLNYEGTATYRFDSNVSISSLSIIGGASSSKRFNFQGLEISSFVPIPVTGIEKVKDLTMQINSTISLEGSYRVLPTNATNKNVEATCSNSFVTIDGLNVTITNLGDFTITLQTEDGGFSTTISIVVSEASAAYRTLNSEDIRFTYDDTFIATDTYGVIPSIGSPNIIVIPVNFSDLTSVYDFNDSTSIAALDAVFNGTKADNSNNYYESLKSFYYKSSYGNLDMNFILSDVFVPSFTSSTFISREERTDGGGTYDLIEEIYSSLTIDGTKVNFNDKKYDINNDGFVDGVWFIYNDDRSSTADSYWPYTYWYYGYSNSINISCFANCSVYFTYEDSNDGLDGHTLFHETGHMLGLDDYYSYDNVMSSMGGLDMMDYNIGDHCSFSKMALGWTSTYIVENATTITIRPFESSGDTILIPATYFNESAFSEYIAIEYYRPTGLNEFDSTNQYPNRPYYFTQDGVRMFHVDARIGRFSGNSFSGSYLDKNALTIPSGDYNVVSSNTASYSSNGYNLIEAITANNRRTYNGSATSNTSLFKAGDSMSASSHTNFFSRAAFHDGSAFDYTITIISMNATECTIQISK